MMMERRESSLIRAAASCFVPAQRGIRSRPFGEEEEVMTRFGKCCGQRVTLRTVATFRSGGTIESASNVWSGISTSLSPTVMTFSRKSLSNFKALGEKVIWEGLRPWYSIHNGLYGFLAAAANSDSSINPA